MFYSHEILTSAQYGVATVWLVATIGPRSNTRKITRKAIQGVNIPKACETIIQPTVPIALRLQSSLLYGVSRVFAQQCTYMLTDAEKVQSNMQTFFRVWGTSTVDPQAGKAKREQLIIQDDPAFELDLRLPAFTVDDDGNLNIQLSQKDTQKTSSQMSPYSLDISSGSHRSPAGINIPPSPHDSFDELDMPFGRESASSIKPGAAAGDVNLPGLEDDVLIIDEDWGIRIDADGNLIEDDQELPDLAGLNREPAAPAVEQDPAAAGLPGLEEEFHLDVNDAILPEAEAFEQRRSANPEVLESSSQAAAAPARRQRTKPLIHPDNLTQVRNAESRRWRNNYLAIQDETRAAARNRPTPASQARKNAYNMTFGYGIGGIGAPTPIPGLIHPLAEMFAGPGLERLILGPNAPVSPHGHRRTSGEAFGDDSDTSNRRRVRPRLDSEAEAARAASQDAQILPQEDPLILDFDLDQNIELGREAPGSALSSRASSAPWNRSSVHGGSSAVKATGAGVAARVSASPLHGRGRSSGLPAIERFSDDMPFGSDRAEEHSSFRPGGTSQLLRDALDQEGRNFLTFASDVARTRGEVGADGKQRWVDFEDLFEPQDRNTVVVTQAFFHVLTLATRSLVKVEQEEVMVAPFGKIRIGVDMTAEEEEEEEEDYVTAREEVAGGDDDE